MSSKKLSRAENRKRRKEKEDAEQRGLKQVKKVPLYCSSFPSTDAQNERVMPFVVEASLALPPSSPEPGSSSAHTKPSTACASTKFSKAIGTKFSTEHWTS